MFYCCGITEKGKMPHNEDALLIGGEVLINGKTECTLGAPFIAAVSDGVSGENAGEIASQMCLELVRSIRVSSPEQLRESLMEVHRRLSGYSQIDPISHNMQTTLCGFAVTDAGRALVFNVGDSRLYRFRAGHIRQISRDQSLVQMLLDKGTITSEEKKDYVHRNIISPAFGNTKNAPVIDIDELEGGLEYGDILLLCSDGLSDFLSSYEIQEIMQLPKPLKKRLDMLAAAALIRGGNDNITAVACLYEHDGAAARLNE